MANELPFKLPVRIESTGEADWVIDAGNHHIAQCYDCTDAEGIVAALNGYAAMREALEAMSDFMDSEYFPWEQFKGESSNRMGKCSRLMRNAFAALNPPAAKEARDE